MIGLKINSQEVKLKPGIGVTLDYNSLLFNQDVDQGDYSFPISIPAYEENTVLFKNKHRLGSQAHPGSYTAPASLYFNQTKILDGTFASTSDTNKEYRGNIRLNFGSFAVMKKKLSEIDLGGDRTLGADTDAIIASAYNTIAGGWPQDFVFVPVINEDFYGDANPDFARVINRFDRINNMFKKNDLVNSPIINQDCLVPFPVLKYVLDQGFKEEGLTCDGDWYNDGENQKLCIINNYALDSLSDPHFKCYIGATPANYDLQFTSSDIEIDNETVPFYDPDDAWDNAWSRWHYVIQHAGKHKIILHLELTCHIEDPVISFVTTADFRLTLWDGISDSDLASVTIDNFAEGETRTVHIEIHPDLLSGDIGKEIRARMLGYVPAGWTSTIDVTSGYIKIDPLETQLNVYQGVMNLKNHVPDMTFGEMLEALKGNGVSIDYDYINRKAILNKIKTQISGTPTDYSDNVEYDEAGNEVYEQKYGEETVGKVGFEWPGDDELVGEENFKERPAAFDFEVIRFEQLTVPTASGQYALVNNEKKIYISAWSLTSFVFEWIFYSYDYQVIDYGGSKDYLSRATPLMMGRFDMNLEGECVLPEMKGTGSSPAFGNGMNKMTTLRLIFWRGLLLDNLSYFYPVSSSTIYTDNQVIPITNGTLDIDFKGTRGFLTNNFGRWFDVLSLGVVIFRKLVINIIQLLNFRIHQRKKINGRLVMQRKMTIELDPDNDQFECSSEEVPLS
jgi:hypothetical protein